MLVESRQISHRSAYIKMHHVQRLELHKESAKQPISENNSLSIVIRGRGKLGTASRIKLFRLLS